MLAAVSLPLPAQEELRVAAPTETAMLLHSGSGCAPFHTLSAYQVDSEIWVTTVVEEFPGGCFEAIVHKTRPMEIIGPAILARNVGDLAENPELRDIRNAAFESDNYQLMARYDEIRVPYDSSLGSGWAETNSIGWVYTRQLPYLYSRYLGWVYYMAGPVVLREDLNPENGADAFDKAEATLFYLWSEDWGWLMTYSNSDGAFYDIDDDTWWNIRDLEVTAQAD